jgi:hypothetical protein
MDTKTKNPNKKSMEVNSTHHLILLHAYNESTEPQKEFLAKELAKDPALHEDLMEIIRAKRALNNKMMSPNATSIRIIMEHSHKTEHLQEI